MNRGFKRVIGLVGAVGLLAACALPGDSEDNLPPGQALPSTPSQEVLRVSGAASAGARLRITLPSIRLQKLEPEDEAQVFVVMADGRGNTSYFVTPANRSGAQRAQFDLTDVPLELTITDQTDLITVWVLVVHNTHYLATERFGLETLAASLSAGFERWLHAGEPASDPLATIVSASEGLLYEWFASVDVLGQTTIALPRDDNWRTGLDSQRSRDGGLTTVYSVQYVSADEVLRQPTPTLESERPGYRLRADELFINGTSTFDWYEGEDSTYVNTLTEGAYEIRLTQLVQRDFGMSWGSIEGERFTTYLAEARVRLVETDVADGRYGIWFHYQDDYNFVYFGLSNQGEYRVAVIRDNSNRLEVQDWTPHPGVRRGAATNTLTVQVETGGKITLSLNGERLLSFVDQTFDGGSIAFFCYAESVPATCRLERLRIWEPVD